MQIFVTAVVGVWIALGGQGAQAPHEGPIVATWASWDAQTRKHIEADVSDANIDEEGSVCHLYVARDKLQAAVDHLRADKNLLPLLAGYTGNEELCGKVKAAPWEMEDFANLLVLSDTPGSKIGGLSGGLHALGYELAKRPGARIIAVWYRKRKDVSGKVYDLFCRIQTAHGDLEFIAYQTSQGRAGWLPDHISYLPTFQK
jgi:hypothetical protein